MEQFVCSVYRRQHLSLVDLRHRLFMDKFRLDSTLPPTPDELKQHVKRANYQAAVWQRSLTPVMAAPNPLGNGWIESDSGELSIHWMTVPVAPPELLDQIYCCCRKSQCSTGLCSCRSKNLRCGPFCKCEQCENSDAMTGDEVATDLRTDAVDEVLNGVSDDDASDCESECDS